MESSLQCSASFMAPVSQDNPTGLGRRTQDVTGDPTTY
jgi:hypothetical protein